MSNSKNRRSFIKNTAIVAAGFYIIPRHVLGGKGFVAPSAKLSLAIIAPNPNCEIFYKQLSSFNNVNITFLSAVEKNKYQFKINEKFKQYSDYRTCLENQGTYFDAIAIADSRESFAIALHALQLQKHICLESSTGLNINEPRQLEKYAEKFNCLTHIFDASSISNKKLGSWNIKYYSGLVDKIYCNCDSLTFPKRIDDSPVYLLWQIAPFLKNSRLQKIECCINKAAHIIFHFINNGKTIELHWIEGKEMISLTEANSLQSSQIALCTETHFEKENEDLNKWIEASLAASDFQKVEELNFSFQKAALLTELILAGNLSIQSFRHFKRSMNYKFIYPDHYLTFLWDSKLLEIHSDSDANQFIKNIS